MVEMGIYRERGTFMGSIYIRHLWKGGLVGLLSLDYDVLNAPQLFSFSGEPHFIELFINGTELCN